MENSTQTLSRADLDLRRSLARHSLSQGATLLANCALSTRDLAEIGQVEHLSRSRLNPLADPFQPVIPPIEWRHLDIPQGISSHTAFMSCSGTPVEDFQEKVPHTVDPIQAQLPLTHNIVPQANAGAGYANRPSRQGDASSQESWINPFLRRETSGGRIWGDLLEICVLFHTHDPDCDFPLLHRIVDNLPDDAEGLLLKSLLNEWDAMEDCVFEFDKALL